MKIKEHKESRAHELAEQTAVSKKSGTLEAALLKQQSRSEKTTEALFRTAYYIAKSNRP